MMARSRQIFGRSIVGSRVVPEKVVESLAVWLPIWRKVGMFHPSRLTSRRDGRTQFGKSHIVRMKRKDREAEEESPGGGEKEGSKAAETGCSPAEGKNGYCNG